MAPTWEEKGKYAPHSLRLPHNQIISERQLSEYKASQLAQDDQNSDSDGWFQPAKIKHSVGSSVRDTQNRSVKASQIASWPPPLLKNGSSSTMVDSADTNSSSSSRTTHDLKQEVIEEMITKKINHCQGRGVDECNGDFKASDRHNLHAAAVVSKNDAFGCLSETKDSVEGDGYKLDFKSSRMEFDLTSHPSKCSYQDKYDMVDSAARRERGFDSGRDLERDSGKVSIRTDSHDPRGRAINAMATYQYQATKGNENLMIPLHNVNHELSVEFSPKDKVYHFLSLSLQNPTMFYNRSAASMMSVRSPKGAENLRPNIAGFKEQEGRLERLESFGRARPKAKRVRFEFDEPEMEHAEHVTNFQRISSRSRYVHSLATINSEDEDSSDGIPQSRQHNPSSSAQVSNSSIDNNESVLQNSGYFRVPGTYLTGLLNMISLPKFNKDPIRLLDKLANIVLLLYQLTKLLAKVKVWNSKQKQNETTMTEIWESKQKQNEFSTTALDEVGSEEIKFQEYSQKQRQRLQTRGRNSKQRQRRETPKARGKKLWAARNEKCTTEKRFEVNWDLEDLAWGRKQNARRSDGLVLLKEGSNSCGGSPSEGNPPEAHPLNSEGDAQSNRPIKSSGSPSLDKKL